MTCALYISGQLGAKFFAVAKIPSHIKRPWLRKNFTLPVGTHRLRNNDDDNNNKVLSLREGIVKNNTDTFHTDGYGDKDVDCVLFCFFFFSFSVIPVSYYDIYTMTK